MQKKKKSLLLFHWCSHTAEYQMSASICLEQQAWFVVICSRLAFSLLSKCNMLDLEKDWWLRLDFKQHCFHLPKPKLKEINFTHYKWTNIFDLISPCAFKISVLWLQDIWLLGDLLITSDFQEKYGWLLERNSTKTGRCRRGCWFLHTQITSGNIKWQPLLCANKSHLLQSCNLSHRHWIKREQHNERTVWERQHGWVRKAVHGWNSHRCKAACDSLLMR